MSAPPHLAERSEWEIDCLFLTWAAALASTLTRPASRAWIEALVVSAVLYLLAPLVNALTTTRGLVASLVAGDAVFAGFDLMMLASSGLPAFAAWPLATRTQDRGFAGAMAR
ncbi:hypothetical protein [Novosphingobium sp.]|uniref:hypothetical protein n=1 Tax=Novosphingobium sp. TaxID=1874826 RepID=UPI0028A6CE14|nr:hypothetical protein [Novosphingobium sp.]